MHVYFIEYTVAFWQDIKDVINWYDTISPNLTDRLLDEVSFAESRISLNPNAFKKFRAADLEKYHLKNSLIKYFSEQKIKLFS